MMMNLGKHVILVIIVLANSVFLSGQSITVNSTNYKQVIDMMGGDIERNSIAVQNTSNTQQIIDWGFKDINFNYCRVQYDKHQEEFEGEKNWGFYTKQVITMKQIKAINPEIKFFATMRTDYDGFGNENNMPDWIVDFGATRKIEIDKYAAFLADYLEFMHNEGVTIHTLSITKEWTSYVYASRAKNIIPKLHAKCDERGIPRAKISDQGFWSMKQGVNYIDDVADLGTAGLYDSFCSHDYDNGDNTTWETLIGKSNALGKKMYHDEFSTGSGAATFGVEPGVSKPIGVYIEKARAYDAGLSGEIFFEIWSRGIDRETRAIYAPNKGEGRRVRGYYIMKKFANNILNHNYMTSSANSTSNVWTVAFRENNKMVLWVINKGSTEYTLPINMDQSIITSDIAAHYWTDDTPIEGTETVYQSSGNSFTPTVKGVSMNCYVFDVSESVDLCDLKVPELIEAECFDDMKDIQTEESSEGTDNVGWINNGDWTKYNGIDLTGRYSFEARVATNKTGGKIEVRLDALDGELIGELEVSNTGGFQEWATDQINIGSVTGVHDIYLIFTGGNGFLYNLNWFGFSEDVYCNNTVNYIEAECHDEMFEIQSEECSEGTKNIGWINDGDWTMYKNIDLSRMNSVNARVSGKTAESIIEVHIDAVDGDIIAKISVTNTGGNQNWVTDSVNVLTTSGIHDVYMVFKGEGNYLFNVNYFSFSEDEIVITGVSDNYNSDVIITPNPVKDDVHILNQKGASILLIDQYGKEVFQGLISNDDYMIDLSGFNSGIYYMRVDDGGQESISKLMKE